MLPHFLSFLAYICKPRQKLIFVCVTLVVTRKWIEEDRDMCVCVRMCVYLDDKRRR